MQPDTLSKHGFTSALSCRVSFGLREVSRRTPSRSAPFGVKSIILNMPPGRLPGSSSSLRGSATEVLLRIGDSALTVFTALGKKANFQCNSRCCNRVETARFNAALIMLDDARHLLSVARWASAISRAYYCSYQAMWAALGASSSAAMASCCCYCPFCPRILVCPCSSTDRARFTGTLATTPLVALSKAD